MRGSDFAELQAFAEVAQHASFARAAERLRMAPSTLSQTIRELEERLGVRLLHRTTRRVSLTGAGTRLLARLGPALADIAEATQDARDQRVVPRGRVRLHVPRPAYHAHVEPALGRLAETLPEVALELTVDDALSGFVADGFDVIVRRGAGGEPHAVEVPLGGSLRHIVLAAPAYLAANGAPARPEALLTHRCIAWRRPETHACDPWRFEVDGRPLTVPVTGSLTVSHCDVAVAAAAAGVGVAYVLEPLARPWLEDGRLMPLLEPFLPRLEGWQLCYPRQRHTPAAVLAVVGALTAT